MLTRGFFLRAVKSVARSMKYFLSARPNVRANPQCSAAPWTNAGGLCAFVHKLLFSLCLMRGADLCKGGPWFTRVRLLSGQYGNECGKSFIFFFFLDLSWIILAASFLLSKIKPLTKEKGLLETNQNKLFEWQFWKTCLILQCPPPIPPLVFDYAWFLLHLLSQKRLNTKYGSHISLQGKRPW